MTTFRRVSGSERVAQLLAVVAAAATGVMCATTGSLEPVPPTTYRSPVPKPTATLTSKLPPQPSATPRPTEPEAPEAEPRPVLPMTSFYSALHELESDHRERHVHIVWLGDSHTAADFMTHEVRKRLQERFGNGGPGFVRLGISPYRHGRVKTVRKGKWRRVPVAPAKETPTDDGVLGLGGMRAIPRSHDARYVVELYRGAVVDEARYELWYRLPTSASGFEVIVDDQDPEIVSGRDGSGSELQKLELVGRPGGALELRDFTGAPELYHVYVSSGEPGVVLDTVGIDGARIATPLAWNGQAWVEELEQREPELIVLSFGTNEVYQEWPLDRYGPQYDAMVARIRTAAPRAACLFVGPTDVLHRGGTHPRVLAIDDMQREAAERLGCAFVSLHAVMGGEGGYSRWMQAEPRLAAGDGVHLTRKGYETLGEALVASFLEDYELMYGAR